MMNPKQPKSPKTTTEPLENKPVAEPLTGQKGNKKTATKPPITKSGNATKIKEAATIPVKKVPTSVKKTKPVKEKVIRDSFSFPEHDYLKISELKQTCLAAGIHVKKSELLRAGLQLLTNLSLIELKKAVEQVEKVKTGRPNS
jgi:hypothetical protein